MGIYDYPKEELKQEDLGAYLSQKNKAQIYHMKLAEIQGMINHHKEQIQFSNSEILRLEALHQKLTKENE